MVQIVYADTIITVGPSGYNYTSIQAAIDAAAPGDTIEVHSGTYYENVVVNKQLKLTGVGHPVVDAGGTGNAITLSWSADGCTLEGFVATNSGHGEAGIKVNSDSNTIEGNNVTGNWRGIYLSFSSGNTISHNNVSHNEWQGIYLYSSSGNTISDNTANDNNDGIRFYSSCGNKIEGNTANDNTDNGINLYASSDNNIVTGNTANGNDNGIRIEHYGCNNKILDNTAEGNKIGIRLDPNCDNNIVTGNTATDNYYDYGYGVCGGYGIHIWTASNNVISGNTATGNCVGIYLFSSSDNNVISGNTATGNTYRDIGLTSSSGNTIYLNKFDRACSSDSTNLWNTPEPVTYAYNGDTFTNYTGNRWSGYTGIDANSDGIGDTPYAIDCGDEMDSYPLATQNGLMYATLSKTANLSSGAPSTKVLFTIEVKNTGQANLDTLTVQDELPYGLEYVSSTPIPHHVENNKVTWDLGSLASGQSESIELVAHINGSNYGPLENRANFTATSTTAGTLEGNDNETVTALRAEIEVNKTANLNSGAPSTILNFMIDVKNSGEADFVSVTLEDLLPNGLDYVSDDSGLTHANDGNRYTWDLGRLNSGESKSFNLTAHINGTEYGELVNWANATGKPEHGDRVEDSDAETVTALRAGIEVNKTANPNSGAPSTNLNFTILVKNSGEADLVSVTVVDFLPEGLDYVSDDSGVTHEQYDNRYVWNLGRLNSSESISFNLTAHINGFEYGDLTNEVFTVGLPEHGDMVFGYDAEIVTALRSGIDMEMTANPTLAALFSDVTFTISVTNTGEIALDPVVLIDELPDGMTYVSADPEPNGTGSIRWDNVCTGSLAPGNTTTINLTARIDGDAKGPLVNLASATGFPLHGDNVSCSCSAEVRLPGLGVNKTADKTEYKRFEEIVYTIVIENLADVPVYDVVVKDVFNRGVEFISADPMPDPDGVWRFDMIQARGTATIKLVVKVPKQDFEFDMGSGVSGEGFVNVADDYSTTL